MVWVTGFGIEFRVSGFGFRVSDLVLVLCFSVGVLIGIESKDMCLWVKVEGQRGSQKVYLP